MKNKKGFTLIELLGVIVLITVILALAMVTLSGISKKRKEQAWGEVQNEIEAAARQYMTANEYYETDCATGRCNVYVSVGTLVNEDYLNKVINPVTSKPVDKCDIIYIENNDGKLEYNYIDKKSSKFNEVVPENLRESCQMNDSKLETVTIDRELECPTNFTGGDSDGWNKEDVTLNYTKTNNITEYMINRYKYNEDINSWQPIDNNSFISSMEPYNITFDDGKMKAQLVIKDASGQTKTCETKEYFVDKEAPTCDIDFMGTKNSKGEFYVNEKINVVLNSSDNNEISNYGLTTSNKVDYNSNSEVNFTPKNEGNLTYYGYVKDAAGNEGSCKKSIEIVKKPQETQEETIPKLECPTFTTTSESKKWYKSNVILKYKMSNNITDYRINRYKYNAKTKSWQKQDNNTGFAKNPGTENELKIYDGKMYATLDIKDKYNQQKSCNTPIYWVDKVKPTVSIKGVPKNETTKNIQFTISATDDTSGIAKIYYGNDNKNWYEYKGKTVLLDKTGVKTVYAKAIDNAGNETIVSATGKCNKDVVDVNPKDLMGTYFTLKFSSLYKTFTTKTYYYAYWNAVKTNDTYNKYNGSVTAKCGTVPPKGSLHTTTDGVTGNLRMKYQRQYYCLAVMPYRNPEINGLNRWTIEYKHAITSKTINIDNYNGFDK